MDDLDYKILRALQHDGRQTNHDLAAQVGLSPSPCLRRVRILEENKVIKGYTAVVDQATYGLPINVFVSLRLERQDDPTIRRFEKAIERLDEIVECYLMTGSRDYLMRVVSENLSTYEFFVRHKLATIAGVSNIESSFALGQVKRTTVLPVMGSR